MSQKFKLSDKFVDEYKDKPVKWGFGDLSIATFKRSYARPIENENRNEEWFETVRRVVEGTFSIQKDHCAKNGLEWNNQRAQKSAKIMYDKIFNFKFSPPGRGLWAMGTHLVELKGSMCLQNCAFVSTKDINIDPLEPFLFIMDVGLLGVGPGFDIKGAGKLVIKEIKETNGTLVIDDSREGWVEALKVTLAAYFLGESKYKLDYSQIRPKGAPIKTFGGVAPGPDPLIQLCERDIPSLLDPLVGEELTSVAITDLMNFIGKCVVAGGQRRIAEIAIGEWSDKDYIGMKNHEKFAFECKDRRWASNNSVFGTVGMDYSGIAEHIINNGEPGVIWLENARSHGRFKDGKLDPDDFFWDDVDGFNPCAEQQLQHMECCTLVETYPANHDSAEEYLETLKYAYMYGKTVTLVTTHNVKSNAVMAKNRRIGMSMSGIEQAITKFGKRKFLLDFCDAGYLVARRWDKIYSNWLGVPRSIRMTTVKPSGTVSLLSGASPGIHKPIFKKYIRYVKFDREDPLLQCLEKAGYIIEEDFTTTNSVSKFCLFPIEDLTPVRYTEIEAPIWEQFQMAADLQKYWSDNSVSVTIKFSSEEANQIADCLATYEDKLKTVSLLPKTGHGYIQAPYTLVSNDYPKKEDRYKDGNRVIWTEEEFDEYRKEIKKGVLEKEIKKIGTLEIKGDKFCNNDTCTI